MHILHIKVSEILYRKRNWFFRHKDNISEIFFLSSCDIDKYFHTLENTVLTVPSTNLYPLLRPIFPHTLVTTVLHHFHSVKGSLYINHELD